MITSVYSFLKTSVRQHAINNICYKCARSPLSSVSSVSSALWCLQIRTDPEGTIVAIDACVRACAQSQACTHACVHAGLKSSALCNTTPPFSFKVPPCTHFLLCASVLLSLTCTFPGSNTSCEVTCVISRLRSPGSFFWVCFHSKSWPAGEKKIG